jgi:hypothetical protein
MRSLCHSIAQIGSLAEGKIYDNPDPKVAQAQIQAFIKTYKIDLKASRLFCGCYLTALN